MAADKIYDAIHEVHITTKPGKPGDRAKGIAPTPPEKTIVEAGTRVSLSPDADLTEELLAAGAIRLADIKTDKAATKVAAKKVPAAKKTPAKKTTATSTAKKASDDGGDDDNEDLM